MAYIVATIDQSKYKFNVNLADNGMAFAKKAFKNPVKALAYVGQLQALGHNGPDEYNGIRLVELAKLWRDNS